jgi:hypothetical protein
MLEAVQEWLSTRFDCDMQPLELTKREMKSLLNLWFHWCGPHLSNATDSLWDQDIQLTVKYDAFDEESEKTIPVKEVINVPPDVAYQIYDM